MNYATTLVRTSVSLDTGTLGVMDSLAKRWAVSKAEVMRRAIRKMKQDVDAEEMRPSPLQAMAWLQGGAGLTLRDGEEYKANIEAERLAKRYWWES
jgi:predicted transcriptional regulator